MSLYSIEIALFFCIWIPCYASQPIIGKSCSAILTCNHLQDLKNANTEFCKYKGRSIGIHIVFSSLEISIESTKNFILLKHNHLQQLLKTIETKERTFFSRMVHNIGGLFLRGTGEAKNTSNFQLSPFSGLHIALMFDDVDPENSPVTGINCNETLFDKKLVAFFIFGIILFFFAETFSRHMLFFYASGVTLGLLMSWMIILIIILKLIPYKKSLFLTLAASGTSMGLYITQSLLMNLQFYAEYHAYWLLWYTAVISLLTFAFLYYKGPPKNIRTLNLIKWSLQILGLMCIFNSTWAFEVAVTSVVLTITLYLSVQYLDFATITRTNIRYRLSKYLGWRSYPQKPKLLTDEEYREQAEIETKKALLELRGYCSSPECNSWKVVSRLKDPKRFASFVQNGGMFQDDELEEYEKYEPDENDDSWLSSDDERQPESTQDDTLENNLQLSEESLVMS